MRRMGSRWIKQLMQNDKLKAISIMSFKIFRFFWGSKYFRVWARGGFRWWHRKTKRSLIGEGSLVFKQLQGYFLFVQKLVALAKEALATKEQEKEKVVRENIFVQGKRKYMNTLLTKAIAKLEILVFTLQKEKAIVASN